MNGAGRCVGRNGDEIRVQTGVSQLRATHRVSVNAYRDRSGAEDGQRVAPVIHNNVEPNVELIVLLAADRVSCGIARDNLASVTRLQISFR